jgi:putative ribosome biogenesis GTPase RsgA
LEIEANSHGSVIEDTPGMVEIRCRVIKEKRILKKLEEE